MKGNAAIEAMLKRRGWSETRYPYPRKGGGTGTASDWHKESTGLWIREDRDRRGFAVLAGTPGDTKPLYRLTGFEHMGDFKDRCRAASMAMEFAERIAPLADWPTAGQWKPTRELGQRMHQIGLDVTGLTDRHLAEVQAARKALPKRMLEAFLALARAVPDPGEGADPEIHLRPLINAVAEAFPQAVESDFDRMINKLRTNLVKGIPVLDRTFKAMVRKQVEAIATEILEEEVSAGKSVREVDPDTGEMVYRRVSAE